jgi:hypothetical protein
VQIHFRGLPFSFLPGIYNEQELASGCAKGARYSQDISKIHNHLFMKKIAVMMLVTHLQFFEMHDER